MRRMHRVVSVAALVAAGAMLAGCSHASKGSADTSAGGSTTSKSADTGSAPAQSALLSAADLPQGMQITPVDVHQAIEQGTSISKGQPTSGQCQPLTSAFKEPGNITGVGMTATQQGTKSAAVIAENLVTKPSGFDLAAVRSAVQSCGSATMNSGRTQVVVTTTATSLSGVQADDGLLLHQDIKTQGAPAELPAPKGNDIALIEVGKKVIVLVVNGDPGVTMQQLAQKAVQKAKA